MSSKNNVVFLSTTGQSNVYTPLEQPQQAKLLNLDQSKVKDIWSDLKTTKQQRVSMAEQNSHFEENFTDFDYTQISNPYNSVNESSSIVYEKLGLNNNVYDFFRGSPDVFRNAPAKNRRLNPNNTFVSRYELDASYDNNNQNNTLRKGYFSNGSDEKLNIINTSYLV